MFSSKPSSVVYKVTQSEIEWAKQKVKEFEKSKGGKWRYPDVEAWRGVLGGKKIYDWLKTVCEDVEWGGELNVSGLVDHYDYKIGLYKIEGKCATQWYYKWITPKVQLVKEYPKDFYIGAKYKEIVVPNEVHVIGWATRDYVMACPIGKKYGSPFYKVPLTKLRDLAELKEILEKV